MSSENTIDPNAIERELKRQKALFVSKLADYGTEDIAAIGLAGIANRIQEKALRMLNLLKGDALKANHESIYDTFQDIMGYGLIGVLVEAGDWPGFNQERTSKENVREGKEQVLFCREEKAKKNDLPSPKKKGDVGFDLYTLEETVIPAHNQLPIDVRTGIRVKLPEGTFAMVINRSSTPRKMGIEVVPGLIDNGYTGELFACCFNRTDKDIKVAPGARLAQFIVLGSVIPKAVEVDELPETERGETGFGSTGK